MTAHQRGVADIFPLTPMQQGMLFHALSAPDAGLYLSQSVLEVTGVADAGLLRAGLADLVARHPVLRTGIVADAPERPLQVVFDTAVLDVPVTDLREVPAGEADRRAGAVFAEHRSAPFDLRRPPLLRAAALRVGDDRWFLVTTHHHVLLDGWSLPILHADLAALLAARRAGRSAELPPVRPFRDFVRWLGEHPAPDPDLHYKRMLADLDRPTPLTVDHHGRVGDPAGAIDWGRSVVLHDTDPADHPERLSRAMGLLPSTVVHAAWGLLLARQAGLTDAVFGMTVSGRDPELPDAAARVGMFVNTVPVRVRAVADLPVAEFLRTVQDDLLRSRDYEQVPVSVAQRCGGIPPHRPLFESVLAFQNYWRPEQDDVHTGDGVRVRVHRRVERTSVPMALAVAMAPRGVWARLDVDRSRIDRSLADHTAYRYARLVATLARTAATAPTTPLSAIPLLTARESRRPSPRPTRLHPTPVEPSAPEDGIRGAAVRVLHDALPLTDEDRLLVALTGVDLALLAVLAHAAAAGAAVERRDPLVPGTTGAQQVTVVVGPAATVAALAPVGVRVVVRGPVPPRLAAGLLASGCTVWRLEGNDATGGVFACAPVTDPSAATTLGRVPGGYLADATGARVPDGAPGELVVRDAAGDVRTGIRARLRTDNTVEELGTVDSPAGTGGGDHRWLEHALATDPEVSAAAVVGVDHEVHAWLVPAAGNGWSTVDVPALLDRLRRTVPAELLPTVVHPVPWLPVTAGGLVDRDVLTADPTAAAADLVPTPTPLTDRLDELPPADRAAFLTTLRSTRRVTTRLRHRRPTDEVPATFAQSQWRALAQAALRPHNEAATGVPPTSRRAAPDEWDTESLAAMPSPIDLAASLAATSARTVPAASPAPAEEPSAILDHGDYACWQADPRRAPIRAEHLAYWRRTLAGAPVSGMPADRVPPGTAGIAELTTDRGVPASAAGEVDAESGPGAEAGAVSGAGGGLTGVEGEAAGAGDEVVTAAEGIAGHRSGLIDAGAGEWLAAVAAALAMLGRDDEVVLGVVTRPELPDSLAEVPGPYARMLPVRLRADLRAGFAALAEDARAALADARRHAEVAWPDLSGLLAEPPLVSVAVHDAPGRLAAHAGTLIGVDIAPAHDVGGAVDPAGSGGGLASGGVVSGGVGTSGWRITAVYDRSRVLPETVRALLERAARLVRCGATGPAGELVPADLTTAADRRRLLGWADGGIRTPGPGTVAAAHGGPDAVAADAGLLAETVHGWVERVAARRGDAVAVEAVDGEVSYRELVARARGLAGRLVAAGVRAEDRVAVCLPRTSATVWAPLGVMMAGAAYLPVDPGYPAARIALMCADAAVPAVVTTEALRGRFSGDDGGPTVPNVLTVDGEPAGAPGVLTVDGGSAGGPGVSIVDGRPAGRSGATGVLAVSEELAGGGETGGSGVDGRGAAYVMYTSGSTGVPKGVVVEHRAVVDFCRHIGAAYRIGAGTRLLGFAALSFDVSVFDLWAALTAGATLVLAGDEERLSVDRLRRLLVERRVTAAELPPSLMPLLEPAELPELRLVSVGGEAPAGALVDGWAVGGREFWNGYGPTETTVAVTLARCEPPSGGRVPLIGRPMPNHRAYVLDERQRLVPPGVPGELCVAGAGLARGYLGRPGLTAERFLPDPYGAAPGGRLYRTGDLVRWTPDGELEFLGRVDRQVKIRGFRVELDEVESVLCAVPGVRQAVVEPWDDPAGTRHLAAYLVPADPAAPPAAAEVRAAAAGRLPDYMVPTRLAVLDRLPLTAGGKVDRAALPAPDAPEAAAPDTETWTDEERILGDEVFAPLLGVERVGRTDDFFGLGGNSLQATQVTSRVRDRFGVEISLIDLFAEPTVANLARLVDRARRRDTEEDQRLHQDHGGAVRPRMAPGAVLPASYPQAALAEAHWRHGANPRHNAPFTIRLRGPLDLAALRRAFALFVERHPTLRCVFEQVGGEFRQRVLDGVEFGFEVVDVPGADPAARRAEVGRLVREESERVFDLRDGPLLRVRVHRLDAEDHVVQWTVHHVATDAWSIAIELDELGKLFHACRDGRDAELPPLTADYADFVNWHQDYVAGPDFRTDLAWWRDRLAGVRPLALPTGRDRAGHRHHAGYHNVRLPGAAADRLRALCRASGATLYMTTLAAYSVLLAGEAGAGELVVVTPNSLRIRSEWEQLVGWFANRVLLRVGVSGELTFAEHLRRVRETAVAAFAHQAMPFEVLRQELAVPDGVLAVCFAVQNAPVRGIGFRGFGVDFVGDDSGLDFTPIGEVYAPLDLHYETSLVLRERPDGVIAGGIEYDAGLFDPGRAARWQQGFQAVLDRAAADPAVRVAELLRVAAG